MIDDRWDFCLCAISSAPHAAGACLSNSLAMTLSAMAQGRSVHFDRECAVKEIAAMTVIEDHGAMEDLPADRLGEAGLTMLRARLACYEGRVGEALALYDSILDLALSHPCAGNDHDLASSLTVTRRAP